MQVKTKAHCLEDKERTKDIETEENVEFSSMYLSDDVTFGLESAGYISPSPIQLAAIPLGRCGLDLIIQAKNGTGKTLVFTVIALEMICVKIKSTQALIVAPTREIAVQIADVITRVGSHMSSLSVGTFIGGLSIQEDKERLRCCHIAVGTPGRVQQLIEIKALDVNCLRLLVLDEADQLLSTQFKEALKTLTACLPSNKQVLAVSATYSDDSMRFVKTLMRFPKEVKLGHNAPALLGVNQSVLLLAKQPTAYKRHEMKYVELVRLLKLIRFNQCLIFSNSQFRAETLCNKLKDNKWPVAYLTGAQTQMERLKAYEDFCAYKCRILVSTDLAARGLDSEHVNLVINMDLPYNPATYLHRVGRAGRYGAFGCAISLACRGDELDDMKALSTLCNVDVGILSKNICPDMAIIKQDFASKVDRMASDHLQLWQLKANMYDTGKKSKTTQPTKTYSKPSDCHPSKPEVQSSASTPPDGNEVTQLIDDLVVSETKQTQKQNVKDMPISLRSFEPNTISASAITHKSEMISQNENLMTEAVAFKYPNVFTKEQSKSGFQSTLSTLPADIDPIVRADVIKAKQMANLLGTQSVEQNVIESVAIESNRTESDICTAENIKATATPRNAGALPKQTQCKTESLNNGYGAWTPLPSSQPKPLRRKPKRKPQISSQSSSSEYSESSQSSYQSSVQSNPYFYQYTKAVNSYMHSMQQYSAMFLYTQTLGRISAQAAIQHNNQREMSRKKH